MFRMSLKQGVPALDLERLLDQERAKEAAMPQPEDLPKGTGMIRFPQNPQATFIKGPAQRNVMALLRQIQQEMTDAEKQAMRRVKLKSGQGMNLSLGAGMRTASLHQQMAFDAIFAD